MARRGRRSTSRRGRKSTARRGRKSVRKSSKSRRRRRSKKVYLFRGGSGSGGVFKCGNVATCPRVGQIISFDQKRYTEEDITLLKKFHPNLAGEGSKVAVSKNQYKEYLVRNILKPGLNIDDSTQWELYEVINVGKSLAEELKGRYPETDMDVKKISPPDGHPYWTEADEENYIAHPFAKEAGYSFAPPMTKYNKVVIGEKDQAHTVWERVDTG